MPLAADFVKTLMFLAFAGGVLLAFGAWSWSLRRRRRAGQPFGTAANDDTPMEVVSGWYRQRRADGQVVEAVDDRTWRDLEMDGVLRALDHCRTPIGRQQLLETLRATPDSTQRSRRSHLSEAISAHGALQAEVARALDHHHGYGGYALWRLMRTTELGGPWLRLAPFMTMASVLLLAVAPFKPLAIAVFIPLAAIGLWLRTYATGTVTGLIGPFREISPVLRAARELTAITDPALTPYAEQLRALGDQLRSLERVSRWVSREVVTSNELVGGVYEYVNLVLMLDANALLLASRALQRQRETLEQLCLLLGQVDVAHAVSSVRSVLPVWCRPTRGTQSGEAETLAFEGVGHPQLPHGVPNDVTLTAGRGMLLTGANMSGKSTLLRILGVNVILGSSLDTCVARAALMTVERVVTCIAHVDDFAASKSLFFAEAEVVVRHLRLGDAHVPSLFLFDELFRGTNAAERIAAAEAVMRRLVGAADGGNRSLVALATHDLELTRLLADCFDTWHLEVTMTDGHTDFRYRLQAGPARMRTALALLEQLGAPADVVMSAATRAASLDARAERTGGS